MPWNGFDRAHYRGFNPRDRSATYNPRFDMEQFRPEPIDLRMLRDQAERIRRRKQAESQKLRNDYERDRLREEIRRAGEKPCC